jgi:heptosyltransferase-2
LTKRRSKADEILESQNIVNDYFWLDRNPGKHSGFFGFLTLVKELKAVGYTAAWIFHKSPQYALACKLAQIPTIYGYGKGYSKSFVMQPCLSQDELKKHPIDRATSLLQAHVIGLKGLEKITLNANKKLMDRVKKKINFKPGKKNIVLCVGGSEPYKKWPDSYYKKLAKWFLEKNYQVFILGGPQEQKEANLIAKELYEETRLSVTVVTDLTIPEAISFLSQITLFIGNDTGMLNVAAATGVQSIGLFGQTPALTYRKNLYPILAPMTNEGQKVSNIMPDQVISFSKEFVDL